MSTNGSSFVPAGGLAPGKLPNGNGASHGIGPEPLPAIAIIGMGMRLPGAIRTADALWETLAEKRSTQCDISATRFSTTGFYNASNLPGCISIQKGFFLEDDLSRLDTSFFSMGIKEVNGMDPQQRMLLEVVYECLESSGQTNWRGSNTACYVGVWGEVRHLQLLATSYHEEANNTANVRIGSTSMQRTLATSIHLGCLVVMILQSLIVLATSMTSKDPHSQSRLAAHRLWSPCMKRYEHFN